MKACIFTTPGPATVLTMADLPMPTLIQPTEMRVKLKAAGINPIDTKIRGRGAFVPEAKVTVLGCDGAGIVESVGSAVRKFSPGDAVFFCSGGLGGDRGNYAEYAIVDEQDAVHKPARLSFAEAAAAPLVLITAWEALYDRARLETHQQVLIHAGGGRGWSCGDPTGEVARRAGGNDHQLGSQSPLCQPLWCRSLHLLQPHGFCDRGHGLDGFSRGGYRV